VVAQCLIPSNKLHISKLPFTGVSEKAVLVETVGISMLLACIACEYEDVWLGRRR